MERFGDVMVKPWKCLWIILLLYPVVSRVQWKLPAVLYMQPCEYGWIHVGVIPFLMQHHLWISAIPTNKAHPDDDVVPDLSVPQVFYSPLAISTRRQTYPAGNWIFRALYKCYSNQGRMNFLIPFDSRLNKSLLAQKCICFLTRGEIYSISYSQNKRRRFVLPVLKYDSPYVNLIITIEIRVLGVSSLYIYLF